MACGRCASQAQVEATIEEHVGGCARGLDAGLAGVASSPARPALRRDLVRAGARFGASMASARGPRNTAAGGVLGAAVGALAGHVLGLPEIRPIVDAASNLREPIQDVIEVVRGVLKK